MVHVFVNGKQVLSHGQHTGATPGRFVRGINAEKNNAKNANPFPLLLHLFCIVFLIIYYQ